jgi:hypothetical protein
LSELGAAAREAAAALTNALQDSDPAVRRDAAKALGEAGGAPKASLAALAALLTDSDEEVRLAVAKALTRLTNDPTQVGMALTTVINDNFIHHLVTDALHKIIKSVRPSGKRSKKGEKGILPKFPWPPISDWSKRSKDPATTPTGCSERPEASQL